MEKWKMKLEKGKKEKGKWKNRKPVTNNQ